MPRASTRNTTSESQSQPNSQPSGRGRKGPQAARNKRRAQAAEDEDEDEEDDEQEQEDEEMGGADSDNGGNAVERKANDLVRLALFAEYRRTALKRDEIAKKVLGGRATKNDFQPIFERAQHILHKTFGMHLHEIMSRAERDKADAAREGATLQEGEANVTGVKKKTTTASSKQYILRSTLDPDVIEAASTWDEKIEEAERVENDALYPNEQERRPDGTLLGWKHAGADQLGATGVLHVILALILVNGRVLTDMQLRTYLKRLRLPLGSTMPSNASPNNLKPLTIDAYLTQLLKQSYLDKQKTSLASGQVGPQKRARGGAAAGGDDGDASFEWKWGTRAIAEIGEEGVGSFVADFMDRIESERENRRADEEGARESGKKEKERLEKRKEKLVTAIGRAAGGGLVPFK